MTESEKRFSGLWEQSPLGIEILTPEGQITQVNGAWMRLWDLNEEETAQVLAEYNMLADQQLKDLGVAPLVERAFAGDRVVLPPIQYSAKRAADEMGLEGKEARSPWIQCHLSDGDPLPGSSRSPLSRWSSESSSISRHRTVPS